MAVQTTLTSLSTTESSNGPDGAVDAPSTLDNQLRYHGKFIAEVRDNAHLYAASIAGTNTITGTIATSPTAYVTGPIYVFTPANTNTGATTVNFNSIGAKNVYRNGAALTGGELQSGRPVALAYDGTQFHVLNPAPFTSGSVLQVVTATDAGSSTTSAFLSNVTGSNKTITPKSANSTFVVEMSCAGKVLAGGAGVNTTGIYQLYNATTSADIGTAYTLGTLSGAGANLQTEGMVTVRAVVTNAALTAVSFLLRARYGDGATTVSALSQVWTITEIQN